MENYDLETHTPNPEKLKVWDDAISAINGFADKLGKPVDEGIKETLAGLIVHGFHTSGSCEGHPDWGIRAPYIDIQSSETTEYVQRAKDAENEDAKKSILKELFQKNLEDRKRLLGFLELFYLERQATISNMLIACGQGWNRTRLQSHSADLQKIEDDETVRLRLQEYQDEMRAFTEFLKQQYFEDSNESLEDASGEV